MRIFRTGSLCRRRHKAALIAEQNLTFCSRSFDASVCGMEVTMENTQSVKSLKKQLMAAIAMVLVAAIALGSSTYAWFVSNNSVKGTTTTISAQSNSAYLVIDDTTTTKDSTATKAMPGDNTPLYPAMIEKNENAAVWMSAYASATDKADMKESTKFKIDDGTAEKAVAAKYAIKNTFYIGTGGYDGSFTDLKIKQVTVKVPTTVDNKNLGNALRILAVCGTNWQVWSATGELLYSGENQGSALASEVKKDHDAQVDIYLYYDGNDTNVYSDNLEKIKSENGNNGVTITFEATPQEYGKASN